MTRLGWHKGDGITDLSMDVAGAKHHGTGVTVVQHLDLPIFGRGERREQRQTQQRKYFGHS